MFSFSVYPRRGFQSTRPARGATGYPTTTWLLYYRLFQSTRPARGATKPVFSLFEMRTISIHAPREGRDLRTEPPYLVSLISIHAPREGRDKTSPSTNHEDGISIHAPREGRDDDCACNFNGIDISIHAPREGRDTRQGAQSGKAISISIHAPREGRDEPYRLARMANKVFQSTRPARGATSYCFRRDLCRSISIHAPREGRDLVGVERLLIAGHNFNPRAPRGARPYPSVVVFNPPTISIHAPREGRDALEQTGLAPRLISIHAPREGRDMTCGSLSMA